MERCTTTRRQFLGAAALGMGSSLLAGGAIRPLYAFEKTRHKVERLGIGAIGMKYQGSVIAEKAAKYGDILAIADVDRDVLGKARDQFNKNAVLYEDYRDLLARDDIDIITIGSPDHWHVQMAIDACRAGKDVYVEKPLSLTVDEGKLLRKVAKETGRVVQVGSWQRSDSRFRLAVEMVRAGRIGDLQRVDVVLGKNVQGGPFKTTAVPPQLNWDKWQGQTTDVPYIPERCHYTFRWWNEYSGGQMTDWGAHHLDIANWAINAHPVEVEGTAKYPEVNDGYNVAVDYGATYKYANGVTLTVSDTGRNGIMFTGSRGRIFANRGDVEGKPIQELKSDPFPRDAFTLYEFDNHERPERAGKLDAIVNHMGNFFDCVEARKQPISDIEGQHRSVTVCHLGNIAMRLGRKLQWNPTAEQFVDDSEADSHLKREQRSGYKVG